MDPVVDLFRIHRTQRKDRAEGQLPAWIPARRTIGGFYVLKPLGSGGSGSVFIVVRSDERSEPGAERTRIIANRTNALPQV